MQLSFMKQVWKLGLPHIVAPLKATLASISGQN
jgi:hypothetical protein